MPKFVTPHGVVIEMGAEAAANVGYKPVEVQAEPKRRAKKKDSEHSSESDD